MWIVLWFNKYRKPADHPTLTGAELRHIYKEAAEEMGPSAPWRKLLESPSDLGIYRRQVPHRSHLVVLPFLSALLFQRKIPS